MPQSGRFRGSEWGDGRKNRLRSQGSPAAAYACSEAEGSASERPKSAPGNGRRTGRRMWSQTCAQTHRLARIGRSEARSAGLWKKGQPQKNGGDHGGVQHSRGGQEEPRTDKGGTMKDRANVLPSMTRQATVLPSMTARGTALERKSQLLAGWAWRIIDPTCERHVSFAGGIRGCVGLRGNERREGNANLGALFTSPVNFRGRFSLPSFPVFVPQRRSWWSSYDLNQCRRRKQKTACAYGHSTCRPDTRIGW